MVEEKRKAILKNGKVGNYTVTNTGKLYSDNTGKEMKGTPQTTTGRLVVTVRADGEKMLDYIHRIVYRTFVDPNLNKDQKVEFKDGDPYNTSLDNLYLCDAYDDRMKTVNRLNQTVRDIADEFVRCNLSPSDIERKYHVDLSFVYKIFYRREFKSITEKYNFYRYGQVYNLNKPPYIKQLSGMLNNNRDKKEVIEMLMNQYGFAKAQAKYIYKASKRTYDRCYEDVGDYRFRIATMADWLVISMHNVDDATEILAVLFNIGKKDARKKIYNHATKYINEIRKEED